MRFLIIIIVGGGILSYNGYKEWKVSSNTKSTPELVKVEEVEKGKKIKNNYVRLDEHIALIEDCVYSYTTTDSSSQVNDNTQVDYLYYPVVSEKNPYIAQMRALLTKYQVYEAIPPSQLPKLKADILIKSEAYKKVGDIPVEVDNGTKLTGLIINSISTLESDEKAIIKQSYPGTNLNSVIIIEQGRTPSSSGKSLLMMAGGVLIILVGGGMGLKSLGKRSA